MSLKQSQGRKKQDHSQRAKPMIDTMLEPDIDFAIVALGASAGGLEAFTQFLSKLPENSGIAFVLVQHLEPSHPSSLVELLGRKSPIPVMEAKEDTLALPDHAYIIPPGKAMSIRNRTLKLQEQPEHPGLTHSINLFFCSLAEDVKERAVGIILSGTGSDGTDGARAIKAQQGLVIVQDPQTAGYDGMPRAAIEAGVADYILPPAAMPSKLMEYLGQSYYERDQVRQALKKDDSIMKSIFSLVKARTGRDFSGYKISSITRRIEHRMAINEIKTVENYLRLLKRDKAEIENLMKDFLIQVTSFFRDKEAFEALKQPISRMLRDKPGGSQLRAWIPGCSTGEEAYSIAIVLLECMQESGKTYEVQVFGTDLGAEAVTTARSGIYPESVAQDVSRERLERFFVKADTSYQIKKNVRERVTFAVHDMVNDPPYSRMDLVSVRNLLIYFDTDLQKKVLPRLHYSLKEDGLLFLGTSETIGDFSDLFTVINAKLRIYQSINKKKTLQTDFINQSGIYQAGTVKQADKQTQPGPAPDQLLLLEALPPSVLIDRNYQVVYTHGDTSKYLRMPEGRLSPDILHLAKPDLRSVLATVIHEAFHEQNEVAIENLTVKNNGGTQPVKITVRPLNTPEGQMVITFEDLPGPKRRKKKGVPLTEAQHQDLEDELQRTRDTLRGTVEELKTANEELRSANEEYMSTNEELKSANEELETSREELQSVNEELTTLNTEAQKKNEDLATVNNDMRNLLNAAGLATVFLDEKLRIRRFTPAATQLFKFLDSDIGRPVEDITSHLRVDSLSQSVHQVLDNLIPIEKEVQTTDGKWYSMRILPYRTLDNNIAGVVVSFADINRVKASLQYSDGIIKTIRDLLVVLDEKLRVTSASRTFYKTFQVGPKDTEGQLIFELGNHRWDIPQLREMLKEVLDKDTVFEGYRVEYDFPGIGQRVMLLNARRIYNEIGATQSILLAMEDVTHRTGLEPFSLTEDVGKQKP
jgi:two-component system CheB/CheR fusion protein